MEQAMSAPPGGGGEMLPPQNLEAEESVLGAMMVSRAAIDAVSDVRLDPVDFYRPRHRTIFEAIRVLDGRGEPVDALTVSELLQVEGGLAEVGGSEVVSSLAASTPAPGNAGHYALIVKQNAILRRLLEASQRIQGSIYKREGEPRELVEKAEQILFNVARAEQAGDFSAISDILVVETERLEKLASGEAEMTGTPSGFTKLDELTGGFQPGNLIILAARPAMGKSALVCNIAENVAWKAKKPVAFFSLEMSETELAHRFIASRAKIFADKLRKGQVTKEWNKVLRACNELAEAPLWIDDSSDLSMLDLRAKARRLMASTGGLGLIIVDYIQLMRPDDPRAGRVEQVGQMSRGLKVLARELQVPVIGLSQLSRAPEQRPDKVPQLADLRESGCLAGDSLVFLPEEGISRSIAELVAAYQAGAEPPKVLAINRETWKLEPKPVTNAFCTGVKTTFELRSRLGHSVRATANHRFLTVGGWRRLDQLNPGAEIAVTGGPVDQAAALRSERADGLPASSPSALLTAPIEPVSAGSRANEDIYWDQILSIDEVGVEPVYDLTVEDLHSFVAEGIVVHNSIEQDADIVGFIYRDEYYYKGESERPGVADLVIAKHRNGPIGNVALAFQEQYPRFINLAPEEYASYESQGQAA
ncbi:MAG: replicative DNA helicase [Solirubrobacterales bacterium]